MSRILSLRNGGAIYRAPTRSIMYGSIMYGSIMGGSIMGGSVMGDSITDGINHETPSCQNIGL
jgi:hypothetical protein